MTTDEVGVQKGCWKLEHSKGYGTWDRGYSPIYIGPQYQLLKTT